MEGFIFSIGCPRETVGIIDLVLVPAGVCRVTETTKHERFTEGGSFGILDTLNVGDMGIIDLTLILEAEYFLEGEVTIRLKHGHSFVGL